MPAPANKSVSRFQRPRYQTSASASPKNLSSSARYKITRRRLPAIRKQQRRNKVVTREEAPGQIYMQTKRHYAKQRANGDPYKGMKLKGNTQNAPGQRDHKGQR